MSEKEKEKLEARLAEEKARQKRNKKMTKKGKATKKELYLARKKALKVEKAKDVALLCDLQQRMDLQEAKTATAAGNGSGATTQSGPPEKVDSRAVDCFLTGLPYLATEDHVARHFEALGLPCQVSLMADPSGRKPHNGTGFATFATAEQAKQACDHSDTTTIQNRWIGIRVCEVRGREGAAAAALKKETIADRPEGCLTAVVKCQTFVSEKSLEKFFKDCQATNISMMTDKVTGEFRGMAFVDFEDSAMVDKAVQKSGEQLKGHPVYVRYKRELKREGGGNQGGRIAAHNRALAVPPPSGTRKTFDDDE